jgi:hypothetical protein
VLPFFCRDAADLRSYLLQVGLAEAKGERLRLSVPNFPHAEWQEAFAALGEVELVGSEGVAPKALRRPSSPPRAVLALGPGRGTTTFLVALARELRARGRKVGVLELALRSPRLGALLGLTEPPPLQGELLYPRFSQGLAALSPAFFSSGRPLVLGAGSPRLVEVYCRDVFWGPLDDLLVEAPEDEAGVARLAELLAPVAVVELGGYVPRLPSALFLQCPPLDGFGLPFDPGLRRGLAPGPAYREAVAAVAERLVSYGPEGSAAPSA